MFYYGILMAVSNSFNIVSELRGNGVVLSLDCGCSTSMFPEALLVSF